MTKSKLGLGMAMMMVATTFTYADIQAEAVVDVAKKVIDKTSEVAITAIKDNTKTTISDSDLIAEIDTKNTATIGDIGVKVEGDTITIDNSTLKTDIEMERTIVIGDVGVNVGN